MQVSIIFHHCFLFPFHITNLNEWICIPFRLCYIYRLIRIDFALEELDDDELQSYISESDKEYVFWVKDEMSGGIASLQGVKFYNRILNVFG